MLILPSEELYTSPATAYRKAVEFLGLSAWEPDDFSVYKQGLYEPNACLIRRHLIDYYRPYNKGVRLFEYDL